METIRMCMPYLDLQLLPLTRMRKKRDMKCHPLMMLLVSPEREPKAVLDPLEFPRVLK